MRVLWTVNAGIKVLAKVMVVHKMRIAWETVVVTLGLSIMFLQSVFIDKYLSARVAEMVTIIVVIVKVVAIVEMFIAALAIGVLRTLNPMLLHVTPGWKVRTTTNVVVGRILLVHVEGAHAAKVAITAITVVHFVKVVRIMWYMLSFLY